MIYNVPLALLSSYSTEDIVVRSSDAKGLVKAVLEDNRGRIKSVQLLSATRGIEDLRQLPPSVQVDLCLMEPNPGSEAISTWKEALEGRALRLVAPVATGFSHAVQEALRAGIRVKLAIDQPDDALVQELTDSFLFFLREPDVTEPVDLFYGLFRSFLTKRVESLWKIQEEHPSSSRYITDAGETTLSERLAAGEHGPDLSTFLADHKLNLFVRKAECCSCPFFDTCEGYFKLPAAGYSCAAIKEFFTLVSDAAAELRTDLAQAGDAAQA
jgi:hypothetical protein